MDLTGRVTIRRDQITSHLDKAGLATNAQLAAAIGVNQSTVSRVLNGKTEPSVRFVAGLLRALPELDARALLAPQK